MKRLLTALILSLCLGLSPLAYAEALTSDQVGRFIAAMPELTELGEKFQDSQSRKIDRTRPLSSGLEQMQGKGAEYTALSQLANSHGFASAEQFADVGDRTMQAYLFAASSHTPEQIEAMYQQGVTNVKNDASLSAAQKERILQNTAKRHLINTQARVAAEKDSSAVRSHMAELNKLFE